MTDDAILVTTADFIGSSKRYLDLALQIEKAMEHVRERLVTRTLMELEEHFPESEWKAKRTYAHNIGGKNVGLELRNRSWPIHDIQDEETYITLGTDKWNWASVWFGAYLSGRVREAAISNRERRTRWESAGLTDQVDGEWPSVYSYLEGGLRDWRGETFLKSAIDDCERGKIVTDLSNKLMLMNNVVAELTGTR